MVLLLGLAPPEAGTIRSQLEADIAVAPLRVEGDSAGVLRSLADSCVERLVAELIARGVKVARHPQLSESDLSTLLPVRWAVLGQLTRDQGQLSIELRLLEVASGDEMRSFLNKTKDSKAIVQLGTAAAGRIAAFLQERKAEQ